MIIMIIQIIYQLNPTPFDKPRDTVLKTLLKTSDKKSRVHRDLKEMEINRLLRPWCTCKVLLEISYAEFVSSVCHEHYDHPNNLQIESEQF